MEPIVLQKVDGGQVMVDPDDLVAVDSYRNVTVVVNSNYQTYFVETPVDKIKNLIAGEAASTERED